MLGLGVSWLEVCLDQGSGGPRACRHDWVSTWQHQTLSNIWQVSQREVFVGQLVCTWIVVFERAQFERPRK